MAPRKKTIIVFTDGACCGNGYDGSYGGIGVHFPNGEFNDISLPYKFPNCTNNKAEFYAIFKALQTVYREHDYDKVRVLLKSDSKYCIRSLTEWLPAWEANDWKNASNKPVLNLKWIQAIKAIMDVAEIEFQHVPAHTRSKDPNSVGNHKADRLAVAGGEMAKKEFGKSHN